MTAVKEELSHGQFLPWIAAEFEMSEDTATNFMNVCSRFGQIPKFSEFKPSVLYLLAAPKTPEAVISKAIEKAESSKKVTVADVRDWKALGYESFVEYGEKELGFASTHLYRLADAAEISLQIGFSPIGEKQPKESQLRLLAQVPEEERKAIWDEATRKAEEEHVTNCGLMLLQVKASKQHGEWLPWLNSEIESGRLKVKVRQTQKYMQLAANTHCGAYLEEAPSIRAALELLSDKEPTTEQTDLVGVDIEAERQARIAAEQQAESERKAIWDEATRKAESVYERFGGKNVIITNLKRRAHAGGDSPRKLKNFLNFPQDFERKFLEFQQVCSIVESVNLGDFYNE